MELFEAQFEPEGSDYIYRRSMKGPAIRVSVAERDAFVRRFRSASQRLTWGMVFGVIALITSLVSLDVYSGGDEDYVSYGVALVAIVPFMWLYLRNWNAPARALKRRPELGQALSRRQASHAFIRRTSYAHFIGYAAISVVMYWNYAQDHDVTQGWARLAPVALVVILCLFTWRIIQKWQLERNERDG